ncbi:MAG: hypothetical protein Q8M92_03625 [Candidatus Subteraquimicrobiales bacterium]|nr:hypothetical protein [Candidatus Subteraquimicrobiales bacterium]
MSIERKLALEEVEAEYPELKEGVQFVKALYAVIDARNSKNVKTSEEQKLAEFLGISVEKARELIIDVANM